MTPILYPKGTIMFGLRPKTYYFGDGCDHVLKPRPIDVKSYFRVSDAASAYDRQQLVAGVHLQNVTTGDMKRYNSIVDVINGYIKNHVVYYKDESKPIFRPVK